MRVPNVLRRATAAFAASAMLSTVAAVSLAQNIVVDSNIFWDNAGGSYATDSGGAGCPGGAFTVTDLATSIFTNTTVDPQLTLGTYDDPTWTPSALSPAVLGNAGYRNVDVEALDPWFINTCYTGAVGPTDIGYVDWTRGWTYFNYQGGLGRTDIDTSKPTVVVNADINGNTTWSSANNYELVGRIGVNPPATLTIEPGTVVTGSGVGSYLVIERGARIDAQGTADAPIIFTSSGDFTTGGQAPGDWGGVVIHGKAQANCVDGCGLTDGSGADCESEGGAGFFGGTDDTDDSGIVRYARVEYAGQEISPNNELNAWTFNAVGTGTTLEFLQAHLGTDDEFEWFGGAARLRYAVATGGDDDNIDWQMGYRGRIQFVVCRQAPSNITANADAGIEADNNEFDFDCPGRSNPIVSHLTLVGDQDAGRGIRLRRGTAFTVVNSIVTGFGNVGLRVENDETFANCPGPAPALLDCAVAGVGDQLTARGESIIVRAAPNPTSGPAAIQFTLPRDGDVLIQIFDVSGRLVDTVVNDRRSAGSYTVQWNGNQAPTGIYFYAVSTDYDRTSGKLVVAR